MILLDAVQCYVHMTIWYFRCASCGLIQSTQNKHNHGGISDATSFLRKINAAIVADDSNKICLAISERKEEGV